MIFGVHESIDRAYCLLLGIHYCEPGNPYVNGPGRAYHPHATEVDNSQEAGWPSGDTVRMHCPICEVTWTEELPQ